MSNDSSIPSTENLSPEEKNTMLFVQMVFQLSGLATMMMGQAPHPETGKTVRDLDAARMLIDQLEMLEIKTKGNLTPDEAKLLQQNLTNLRFAFVEAVEKPEQAEAPTTKKETADTPEAPASKDQSETESAPAAEPSIDHESKVKFSKKY